MSDTWLAPDPASPFFRVELIGPGDRIEREFALLRDFDAALAAYEAMAQKFAGREVILRQRGRVMRRSTDPTR